MTQDDLTPQFRQTLDDLHHQRRQARTSRWLTIGLVVLAVITVGMYAAGVVYGKGRLDGTDATLSENTKEIAALREDMKTVCRQADPKNLPTSEQDKCFRAEANLPPKSAPAAQQTTTTITQMPSDDQLLTLIRGVIAANPPKDGHTPTADELLALIKPLIPLPLAGQPGTPGEPGKTPTDEQLLALIQQVYDANPPAAGPTGPTGPMGPQGVQGEKGEQGEKGSPTQWDWPDPVVPGVTHSCTVTPGSDGTQFHCT